MIKFVIIISIQENAGIRDMMKIKITTVIQTDEDNMWAEIKKVSSLVHIASPILIFKPPEGDSLPKTWETGIEYCFNLLLLQVIPLGKHYITLTEANKNRIISHEHSRIISLWVHTITFAQNSTGDIDYTDQVEIDAGILTLPVWLFSHIFYRYRQYRWRKFFMPLKR